MKVKKTVLYINSTSSFFFMCVTPVDASQSYGNTDESPNLASAVGDLVHDGATPSSLGTVLDPSPTTSAPMTTARSLTMQSSSTKPSDSVNSDALCSAAGQKCSGTYFATCSHHQWILQPCPSGLTCVPSTNDGNNVYCGSSPSAYKNNRVQAHLTILSTTNSTWAAILNARRTDPKPFGSHIVVHFPWPDAPLVSVQYGTFAQSVANVVLQIKNPHRSAMALVVRLTGTILPSRVLITPPSIHFYS
jgi:chitinase